MARRKKNPSVSQHHDNVPALLQSANEHLDLSRDAFTVGDVGQGWEHYLEALKEIARAQQEVVHASEATDEDKVAELDQYTTILNNVEATIRQGLRRQVGADVRIADLFVREQTGALPMGASLDVPVTQWIDMRAEIVRQLVARYGGVRRAAAAIGVPKSTLQYWVRKVPDLVEPTPARRYRPSMLGPSGKGKNPAHARRVLLAW